MRSVRKALNNLLQQGKISDEGYRHLMAILDGLTEAEAVEAEKPRSLTDEIQATVKKVRKRERL